MVAGTWRTRSLCTRCAARRPWPTANARPTTAPWGPGRGPSGPAGNDGPFPFPPRSPSLPPCSGGSALGPAAGLAVRLPVRAPPSPEAVRGLRARRGPPPAPTPGGARAARSEGRGGRVRSRGAAAALCAARTRGPKAGPARRPLVSETHKLRRRPIPLFLVESHLFSQMWGASEDLHSTQYTVETCVCKVLPARSGVCF